MCFVVILASSHRSTDEIVMYHSDVNGDVILDVERNDSYERYAINEVAMN